MMMIYDIPPYDDDVMIRLWGMHGTVGEIEIIDESLMNFNHECFTVKTTVSSPPCVI